MNRSLKLSVLLALALGSSQAVALELGQIQIKSALGQPLLAEIPVNPENPAELQNLTARLASSDAFAQANIPPPSVLLQFNVADGANGKKVIRVTSSVPITDPYLDLLVEVDSGSNKSVREFTVLLDPPASQQQAQAPVTRTPAATTTPAHARTSRQSAPAAEAAAPSRKTGVAAKTAAARPASSADGKLAPVEHGQTLSGIARSTAPAGVDMNQMLIALKQANPDAFYRDNINALKAGAVLRVPSKEDAQAMAAAAALAEVSRQNSDWRSGAAKVPTTVADAGTRASATSSPSKASNSGDRLALVPAKEGGANGAGKGSKSDSASMHQDLLRSQETLTALQQQSDELKSRLKDLEDINGKNERLLSLKDNEIAELQHKLADARKSAGAPIESTAAAAAAKAAAPTAEDKTVVATAKPEPKLAAVSSAAQPAAAPSVAPAHAGTAAAAAVASAATAAPKPVAPPFAKPAPVKQAPVPVEEDPWYMQTWAWAAGAGAIVVLALLALLSRRRKPVAVAPAATGSSLAERFGAAPVSNAADPDQDELLDQLAEHPDDIGLHLELVSLYYGRRDVEHFEAAAEAMHAHIANPQQVEWQDVVHMGEDLVPGHPLFTNTAPQPPHGADEHAALHHFDLDSYSTDQGLGVPPPIKPAPIPPAEAKSTVSEYHFGFNLTPGAEDTPIVAHDLPAHHEPVKPVESVPHAEHTSWQFADEPVNADHATGKEHHDFGHFSDDPSDTKLDLARAYLDMGDPDGARSMLEEVLHEGTQMQKDTAKRLLADLH